MSAFTFGTDPEFLILNEGYGYVSAIDVLGEGVDKFNPKKIKGNSFFYDNVLIECTVTPSKSKEEAVENVRSAIRTLHDLVKPHHLVIQASAEFPDDLLKHTDARKVGCSPDTCAYSLEEVRPPFEEIETSNLRSCGGHIHLGNNFAVQNDEGPEPIFTVYMLDLFLGIPSLYLDTSESAAKRRKIYGKAGRYRWKEEYGLEYRSLSNFWLAKPELVELMYDLSSFAIDFVESGRVNKYWSFDEDKYYESEDLTTAFTCTYNTTDLRDAIDKNNRQKADVFFNMIRSHLPISVYNQIQKLSQTRNTSLRRAWGV